MFRYLVMAMRTPQFQSSVIEPHQAFLERLRQSGNLEMSGPFTDETGGAYLIRAANFEEERDWTYFGDALFNNAFKNTRSFPDAFAEAKKLIEKWEGEQGLTPSDPQIFAGSAITEMLKAFPFPSTKSTPDVARPPIAAQIADDDFHRGRR